MTQRRLKYIGDNIHDLHAEDRIIGSFLYDQDKEVIAKIDGLVVEAATFLPRFLVVTLGGFLRIQGKRILVPREIYEVKDVGKVKSSWRLEQLMDIPEPVNLDDVSADEEELILSHFDLKPYQAAKSEEDDDQTMPGGR